MPRQEMMTAAEESKMAVRLEPFVHQVGGHASMLRLNDVIVCKPLVTREYNFYESMPPVMAEFTPQYRGKYTVPYHAATESCLSLYLLHYIFILSNRSFARYQLMYSFPRSTQPISSLI